MLWELRLQLDLPTEMDLITLNTTALMGVMGF